MVWGAVAEIFGRNAGTEELEAFYPIKPECIADVPKTRFRPRVGKTLSARRWHAAFSEDGHLDIAKVLRRIQRGGIHPSIKGVVWEFLLGCFDPNSTFEDRNQLRQQRRERYGMWKTECQNMVPIIGSGKFITTPIITDDGQPIECEGCHVSSAVSDKKVAQWMLSLHQIGLDVVRTDQTLTFYENETNQAKLWDVLAIYSWVDGDIGYVQGMNDICSPMVILLEDEADAFWCFERAMRKLRENFRCTTTSMGVQSQLGTLSQIIKTVDPKLHQHLGHLNIQIPNTAEEVASFAKVTLKLQIPNTAEEVASFAKVTLKLQGAPSKLFLGHLNIQIPNTAEEVASFAKVTLKLQDLDGGEYLFAIRMLMVLFRREFSFVDALYLWEVMWAMEYNPNIFSSYEMPNATVEDSNSVQTLDPKLLKQFGKFERTNLQNGHIEKNSALAVFLVASVLETKNKQILNEAKGLDDVVNILGGITGNLDAKKACKDALKIQNKYLKKAKNK